MERVGLAIRICMERVNLAIQICMGKECTWLLYSNTYGQSEFGYLNLYEKYKLAVSSCMERVGLVFELVWKG